MHIEVSEMAQAASLEMAERGLLGETRSSRNTVENTYGNPKGSLIWALASHQITRINWLKGLAPDAQPRLGTSAGGLNGVCLVKELSGELGIKGRRKPTLNRAS